MLSKINRHAYDNAEIKPWSVRAGDNAPALTGLELKGELLGPLGQFELVKRFASPFKDKIAEVSYKFPMPGDAAVTSAIVEFGDNAIVAQLKEKEEAVQTYNAAKQEGKQAAIVERVSEDTFSLTACGILPNQPFVIRIKFFAVSRYVGHAYRAVIPTIDYKMRYQTKSDRDPLPPAKQVDVNVPDVVTESGKLSGSIRIRYCDKALCNISSSQPNKEGDDVVFKFSGHIPDEHMTIDYSPPKIAKTKMAMYVHDDGIKKYFLGMVVAGTQPKLIDQDLAFSVDISGSMGGSKAEAAKQVMHEFMDYYRETNNRVCPMLFESTSYALTRRPERIRDINPSSLELFNSVVGGYGGTNLDWNLKQMAHVFDESDRQKAAILVTDMQVDSSVLDHAKALGCPIHIIMVGAAPNDYLAHRMATISGGTARYLEDRALLAKDIMSHLESVANPVATGVHAILGSNGSKTQFEIGTLYQDCPAVFMGCCESTSELSFELQTQEGVEFETMCVEGNFPAVKNLYGSSIVYGLEYEYMSAKEEPRKGLRRRLVDASLEFGVVCSETAFVAVGKKVGKVEATWKETLSQKSYSAGYSAAGQGATLVTHHAISFGISGVCGPTGPSGPIGMSGCSGFSGHSGASGFSGFSGATSPQFYSPLHTPQNWQTGGVISRRGAVPDDYLHGQVVTPEFSLPRYRQKAPIWAEIQRLMSSRYRISVQDYELTKMALEFLAKMSVKILVEIYAHPSRQPEMTFLDKPIARLENGSFAELLPISQNMFALIYATGTIDEDEFNKLYDQRMPVFG